MIIPKPKAGNFKPAPAGTKPAVLIDFYDLGTVETKFGDKEMVRAVFQTGETFEKDGDTLNYNVASRYNKSLHEKASLRKVVEALLSRKMRAADWGADGFDPELLIGNGVLVSIVHSEPQSDGTVYANIESMMPLPDGMAAPDINDHYVRVKDRDDKPGQVQAKRDEWAKGSTSNDEPAWAAEELPL